MSCCLAIAKIGMDNNFCNSKVLHPLGVIRLAVDIFLNFVGRRNDTKNAQDSPVCDLQRDCSSIKLDLSQSREKAKIRRNRVRLRTCFTRKSDSSDVMIALNDHIHTSYQEKNL